jgi:hypothetical protein
MVWNDVMAVVQEFPMNDLRGVVAPRASSLWSEAYDSHRGPSPLTVREIVLLMPPTSQ